MSIYIVLSLLCVTVACSSYMGWVAGINSKRNASYRKGYARGYAESDVANSVFQIMPRQSGKTAALRRDMRAHNERVGL